MPMNARVILALCLALILGCLVLTTYGVRTGLPAPPTCASSTAGSPLLASAVPMASAGQAKHRYVFDLSAVSHRIDTAMFFGTVEWPETDEAKQLFLPRLRQYGIRLIRNDLHLQEAVPKTLCPDMETFRSRTADPGFVDSWDWSPMTWVAEAKREGFRTMGIFCFMPEFLTANGSLPRKGDRAAWEAWGTICAEVYKRLAPDLDYIEIYNEAQFFAKADNTGYVRSVEADPDIFHYAESQLRPLTKKPIIGPATWIDCWAGSGLETLPFDPRSTPETLDRFSIHDYDTQLRAFLDRIDHTRATLDGTAPNLPVGYAAPWKDKPLWVTEWNQYWEDPKVGADWYGFILTEFLARDIPNTIYSYDEFFDPKRANVCRPWLLLVECGLNSAAQTVEIHPQVDAPPTDTAGNSVAATLPDGSVVVVATNTTDQAADATWRLRGLRREDGRRMALRVWDVQGDSERLTTSNAECSSAITVRSNSCEIRYTLPPHSMAALKLAGSDAGFHIGK